MWLIAIILVIVILVWWHSKSSNRPYTRPQRPPSFSESVSRQGSGAKAEPTTFRPSSRTRVDPRIRFSEPTADGFARSTLLKDIEGLHDAFTGAPLNINLGIYQCNKCRVYYHAESRQVIVQENAGQCVACSSTSLLLLSANASHAGRGRDHNPNVITLANFRQFFSHVVTFEGVVVEVKTSRKGADYAVMFESKSWTKGLKLVFFRGAVARVGGATFVHSLKGRRVRVRGLLSDNPRFGPQIVVTQRSMILSVN